MHVSGAHNSPVTCLEWSPDGELLHSGDVLGKVYVTVIKFQEVFIEFIGGFRVANGRLVLQKPRVSQIFFVKFHRPCGLVF